MSDGVIEERSSLIKNDVNMIDILVSRSNRVDKNNPQSHLGLVVTVKVQPEVEDFMRSLGGGAQLPVSSFGRYWSPLPPMENLLAYDLQQPLEMGRLDDGHYRLDALGSNLDTDREGGINISFLRLVGASEGTGVRFGVRGVVHTEQGIKLLRDRLGKAARAFYIDYLRPIDASASVVLNSQNYVYPR